MYNKIVIVDPILMGQDSVIKNHLNFVHTSSSMVPVSPLTCSIDIGFIFV